jgi:hypothetical protein
LVLSHLTEAQEEIATTIREIRETPDYDYGEFWVAMQHLYHHANTAWNSRDTTEAQVVAATDEDFNRWSQFPTDLPMMEVQCTQLPNTRLKLTARVD